MKRKLLVEEILQEKGNQFLKTEGLPPGVIAQVKCVGGKVDIKNRNNRVYSRDFWEGLLKDKNFKFDLNNRRLFGEADHPDELNSAPGRVSHLTTRVWVEGDTVWTENDIIATPAGMVVKALLEAKCLLGFSSRGYGDVEYKDEAEHIKKEGFKMKGWDFVMEPSTIGGYVQTLDDDDKKEAFLENASVFSYEEGDEISEASAENKKKFPAWEVKCPKCDKIMHSPAGSPIPTDGTKCPSCGGKMGKVTTDKNDDGKIDDKDKKDDAKKSDKKDDKKSDKKDKKKKDDDEKKEAIYILSNQLSVSEQGRIKAVESSATFETLYELAIAKHKEVMRVIREAKDKEDKKKSPADIIASAKDDKEALKALMKELDLSEEDAQKEIDKAKKKADGDKAKDEKILMIQAEIRELNADYNALNGMYDALKGEYTTLADKVESGELSDAGMNEEALRANEDLQRELTEATAEIESLNKQVEFKIRRETIRKKFIEKTPDVPANTPRNRTKIKAVEQDRNSGLTDDSKNIHRRVTSLVEKSLH